MRQFIVTLHITIAGTLLFVVACGQQADKQQQSPRPSQQQETAADTVPATKEESIVDKINKLEHLSFLPRNTKDSLAAAIEENSDSSLFTLKNLYNDLRAYDAAIDKLPDKLLSYLVKNKYSIAFKVSGNGILKGEFREKGQREWAILCATDSSTLILVAKDGADLDPVVFEENDLSGGLEYSRSIPYYTREISVINNQAPIENYPYDSYNGIKNLEQSYNAYHWPESPPKPKDLSRDGIKDNYPYCPGASYLYFSNDEWVKWGDTSEQFYDWWYNEYAEEMQDSLLLDPAECDSLPETIVQQLKQMHLKVAYIKTNPLFITGEFRELGSIDYAIWTYGNDGINLKVFECENSEKTWNAYTSTIADFKFTGFGVQPYKGDDAKSSVDTIINNPASFLDRHHPKHEIWLDLSWPFVDSKSSFNGKIIFKDSSFQLVVTDYWE